MSGVGRPTIDLEVLFTCRSCGARKTRMMKPAEFRDAPPKFCNRICSDQTSKMGVVSDAVVVKTHTTAPRKVDSFLAGAQPEYLPIENIRRVIRAEFPEYGDFAKAHDLDERWFAEMMRSANRRYIDWVTADEWCNLLGLHPVLLWPNQWDSFKSRKTRGRHSRLVAA